MAKLGTLLHSLSVKAGIKLEDDFLKKLLSNTDIANIDVPDEFNQALEGNLLTLESAVANTSVRSKLFAEALNGADAELDRVMNDFEFDDTFKGTWKGITKNTNEKIRTLTKALKEREASIKKAAEDGKKADPNAEAQVNNLKSQIADLNKSLENTKLTHQTELQNEREGRLNDRKDFVLQSTLASKPLPKNGLPADINILTAKTLISQEMAKKGLIVQFDANNQPVLKQRKDGSEIDYFENNKPVSYADFIDGALAQNKFIQVNDPAPTPGGGNNPGGTPNGGGQQTTANTSVVSAIDSQLAQLGVEVGTQV